MHTEFINFDQNNKHAQFRAINDRFLTKAKQDIGRTKYISCEWVKDLKTDIFVRNTISREDAIDTINAVKKLIDVPHIAVDELLENCKNQNYKYDPYYFIKSNN